MEFTLLFSLLILALSLETFGMAIKVQELCPSALFIKNESIPVGEQSIQHSTLMCPDGMPSLALPALSNGSSPDGTDAAILANGRRSVSECNVPVPFCACGDITVGSCPNIGSDGPPVGDDCAILLDSLGVVSEQSGPLFSLPSQSLDLLKFQSCGILFGNLSNMTLEYCWDELSFNLGVQYSACIVGGLSNAGQRSGTSGLWSSQILRVSP